jgi:hypothetical protein
MAALRTSGSLVRFLIGAASWPLSAGDISAGDPVMQ